MKERMEEFRIKREQQEQEEKRRREEEMRKLEEAEAKKKQALKHIVETDKFKEEKKIS